MSGPDKEAALCQVLGRRLPGGGGIGLASEGHGDGEGSRRKKWRMRRGVTCVGTPGGSRWLAEGYRGRDGDEGARDETGDRW